MKIFKQSVFVFLLSFLVCSVGVFAQNGEYPAEGTWFSYAVEQNGEPVEVKDNEAVLEKAPFTFVLILRGPIGVLANFSYEDSLYKGFLLNKPLAEITKKPDFFMGIGEPDGNADEFILIDPVSPHYLYYSDASANRFSTVEAKDDFFVGRRVISNYTTYANEFALIPIEKYFGEAIYVNMMYSEWDENYNKIELQKEALKIVFK